MCPFMRIQAKSLISLSFAEAYYINLLACTKQVHQLKSRFHKTSGYKNNFLTTKKYFLPKFVAKLFTMKLLAKHSQATEGSTPIEINVHYKKSLENKYLSNLITIEVINSQLTFCRKTLSMGLEEYSFYVQNIIQSFISISIQFKTEFIVLKGSKNLLKDLLDNFV